MSTRDLTYLIDFNVEGAADLATASQNMEDLAEATNGVDETATVNVELPPAEDIEAIGELGADGGPIDRANDKAGGLTAKFGDMVGAIGLVNIATAGVDLVMGKFQERQEKLATIEAFDDAQVLAFAEAIRQAGDDVTNLVDALEGTQRITGIDMLSGEVVDITNDLANAGVTADEYYAVLAAGPEAIGPFIQGLEDAGVAESTRNNIQVVAIDNMKNLAAGTLDAAGSTAVFAESQQSANQALQDLLADRDQMGQFTDEWDLLKESMSDGSIDTTAAANALNTLKDELGLTTDQVLELAQADLDEAAAGALAFADALNSIDFQATAIEGATTAFSAYTDQLFAAANEAEAREAAFDALSAAAENQSLTFSAATEAGRAQSDALEAVARVIDEDLADAYANADGSQAAFVASATKLGDETLARLQTELGLTDAQVETLRNTLGLTAADYEARFNLAGAEEARLQLDLLGAAIAGLPANVEQTVTQQILAGDFVAARDTVAQYYADNPVPLSTETDTSEAEGAFRDFASEDRRAPIVADAETFQAASDLLDTADEPRSALIVAHARTAGAEIDLAAVANAPRTAYVDVATGSIDMPSNTQLRNQIGTIRVPVQLYYNSRIEGSRPGP